MSIINQQTWAALSKHEHRATLHAYDAALGWPHFSLGQWAI
jgi:hypothetical protein